MSHISMNIDIDVVWCSYSDSETSNWSEFYLKSSQSKFIMKIWVFVRYTSDDYFFFNSENLATCHGSFAQVCWDKHCIKCEHKYKWFTTYKISFIGHRNVIIRSKFEYYIQQHLWKCLFSVCINQRKKTKTTNKI